MSLNSVGDPGYTSIGVHDETKHLIGELEPLAPTSWRTKDFILMEPVVSRYFIRALIAEFIGTAFLVGLACGSGLSQSLSENSASALAPALTTATIIAALCFSFESVSRAFFNPAVTVGMFLAKEISLIRAACYIVVQYLGAIVGVSFLLAVIPDGDYLNGLHLGSTMLAPGLSQWQGILIEILITFVLMMVICCIAINPRQMPERKIMIPFGLFCVILANIYSAGPLTGASMNPARSFAPALLSNFWDNQYVYFVGPMIGALLGVGCYLFAVQDSLIHLSVPQ